MAQDKVVPLTLGIGGRVIGSAKIDENGFLMAEIDEEVPGLFPETREVSIVYKEKTDDN